MNTTHFKTPAELRCGEPEIFKDNIKSPVSQKEKSLSKMTKPELYEFCKELVKENMKLKFLNSVGDNVETVEKIEFLENKILDLEKQVEDYDSDLFDTRKSDEHNECEIKDLTEKVEELEEDNEDCHFKIKELEKELEEQENDNEELRELKQDIECERNYFKNEYERLIKENEELKKEIKNININYKNDLYYAEKQRDSDKMFIEHQLKLKKEKQEKTNEIFKLMKELVSE